MRNKFVFILFSVVAFGCGNSAEEGNDISENDSTNHTTAKHDTSTSPVLIDKFPQPMDVSKALKEYNAGYSPSIFEKTKDKTGDYLTNYSKAINLGIYCVDLGYASINDDNYNALKYLDKIQSVMNELNLVSQAELFSKRFKENINKKDSIYQCIVRSYNEANEYYRRNNREDVEVMIYVGGFIEGLYISTQFAKANEEKTISLISNQQKYLENAISLMKTYCIEEEVEELLLKLDNLKSAYYGISPDTKNISEKQLNIIRLKVSEIRNHVVN